MAVHPFAIKLENAVRHAQDLLESLRRAKSAGEDAGESAPWWDWIDSSGRKRIITRIFGNVQLGALAAGSMERQGFAEPGEAAATGGGKSKNIDRELAALNEKYFEALSRCAQDRAAAEANGSQILEDGSRVAAPKRSVQMPCPAAAAAAKAISAYIERKTGGRRLTGDGGGGGW